MNFGKTDKLEPNYLLYDDRMLLHRPIGWVEPAVFPEYPDEVDDDYPMENPERLRVIYERLCNLEDRLVYELDVDTVFKPLSCEMATKEQVCLAHSEAQYERLNMLQYYDEKELLAMTNDQKNDNYFCQESFKAARLAAGGLLSCVDAVCDKSRCDGPHRNTNKAIALVRPPGHHACQSKEMGFCFIDSVAVAAKYSLVKHKAKRIAILDWDIHDGNGTSETTINNPDIFRIDIHRYNPKEGFYPYTGAPHDVGNGNARGLNLNLGWSYGGMGNTEYAAAFYELILPLLAAFQPDLLLISCGLDAAMGDLLGGCELTPDFFHAMTRAAIEVVGPNTPIVCALEGGYTMSVIPDCMEAVTLAMLHCPYRYHSELQLDSFWLEHAAAQDPTPWPTNPLQRARRVLQKYYDPDGCSRLIYSAKEDINTCIRIFKGITRWNSVPLKRLKGPPKPQQSKKRKGDSTSMTSFLPAFQRPRIYLWYGTERHHQKVC